MSLNSNFEGSTDAEDCSFTPEMSRRLQFCMDTLTPPSNLSNRLVLYL
jgi:hypothetical protein